MANWDELQLALDPISRPLWNDSWSSYNGLHDRIDETAANKLDSSLRLVEVTELKITVAVEGTQLGGARRKVRGHRPRPILRYPSRKVSFLGGTE